MLTLDRSGELIGLVRLQQLSLASTGRRLGQGGAARVLRDELDLGPYYGANLDALWDRLSTDVERPVRIVWRNSELSERALGADRFEKVREVLRGVEARDRSLGWLDRFVVRFV
ncbi:barstar family protein [Allokutzneria sp. NRRL B-24872]|uniref:barstar family protein n=1 Tax=Allokutzneria sp. NRRL B-24872 TaxID=1137961 RepID=UPI001FEDF9E6|nr:barstar family protein [Allokutzneria sp. NRRL B-24872]